MCPGAQENETEVPLDVAVLLANIPFSVAIMSTSVFLTIDGQSERWTFEKMYSNHNYVILLLFILTVWTQKQKSH